MSELVETLRSLGASFDALGLRWYVFGAQAAILHGIARATADIDVTVDPAERSTKEIATSLSSNGFVLRVSDQAFIERSAAAEAAPRRLARAEEEAFPVGSPALPTPVLAGYVQRGASPLGGVEAEARGFRVLE